MTTERPKKLLQVDTNAKTVKGRKKGFMTGILYLAPAKLSGWEVCPQRSAGCTAACLNTAGRGVFSNVQEARRRKTAWYFEDRAGFMRQLVKDVAALVRKAEREGLTPVVRLNGTSDIPWERVMLEPATHPAVTGIKASNIFEIFPDVQFYDYTKITKRALAHANGDMPRNYHLTFSLTEANDHDAREVLMAGGNVAAVFRKIPASFYDYPVVDGDETDLRFADASPQGFASVGRHAVVVGLKAKGKARRDASGFVR